METRNIPVIALFLFLASVLYAQDYFVDTSGETPRIFQRLIWFGDENIFRYEVFIQEYSEEENEYHDVLGRSTTDNFIAVSLPPGKYRYSVIPYDLLGLRSQRSEWIEFEIVPALFPSVEKFSPAVFFLDKRTERVLYITGDNLLEESEIYLHSENKILYPVDMKISEEGQVILVFDDETLFPGKFEIYIRNPGGMETSAVFLVGYSKPLDLFIKSSWASVVPVYGGMFKTFGMEFYPAGTHMSFEAITSKRAFFNGGMEISAAGYAVNRALSFKKNFEDVYDSSKYSGTGAVWMEANLNMVLQKRFLRGRMIVSARAGGGIAFMSASGEYKHDGKPLFSVNAGLSYMYLLHEILYIDAGLDYSHVFSADPYGLLKPRLGLCWQF